MSQEYGILGWTESEQVQWVVELTRSKSITGEKVGNAFKVGNKVVLHVHQVCITAAQHFGYVVVDEEDIVREA